MSLFVKMDIQAVQNGLIEKVGGVKHFSVLAAIASFADSKGESFPSQDKLAEMVGYSRKTVNAYVGDLRNVYIDGQPIIEVVQIKTKKGRLNKYILSPKSGFRFGNDIVTKEDDNVTESGQGVVTNTLHELEVSFNENHLEQEKELKEIVFDNAKSVLDYFREQYFEQYNVAYVATWGREQKMIKDKLLSSLTDSEIKAVIDFVISEYEQRWANPKFPRPTIGQICSWLTNEALGLIEKNKKQVAQVKNDSKQYEYNDEQWNSLLDEI